MSASSPDASRDVPAPITPIAPRDFRNAVGLFATGVTIVTVRGTDGQAIGLTANSFASVSLDPPLILWSLAKKSVNLAHFLSAPGFAIHVLSREHRNLAQRFASPVEERFKGLDVAFGHSGAPLLEQCAVRLECEKFNVVDAGDHHVFIGRVVDMRLREDHSDPLVFHRGKFVAIDCAAIG